MASALLASNNHNEPRWKEPMLYMRQNPNPNNNTRTPNFTNRTYNVGAYDHLQPMDSDEATASTADPAADHTAVSGDSSTFQNLHVDSRGYVTFNISSYSRSELRDLKRRLVFELDQIRSFSARIESYGSVGYSTTTCSAAPSPAPLAGSDDLVVRSEKSVSIAGTVELKKLENSMMKKCGQLLSRIMKHKGGVWFNTPVDVVGMNLHDYNHIIKTPMDLGTVKAKLNKGMYSNCVGFADDVRLTFKNAIAYNPPGHDVHKLADQLLKLFEGSFGPAHIKFEKQKNAILKREQVRQGAPPPPAAAAPPKTMIQLPVVHQQQQQQGKAKVREMSMKEKERLGAALQNLPEEKMNEVLEIVRRRNVETPMDGDEVEIDFELMDSETLWELDRFVVDWNKTVVSRIRKRQKESPAFLLTQPCVVANQHEMVVIDTTPEAEVSSRKSKIMKGDSCMVVEDDVVVDIGDEMPAVHYPAVVIEKQESSSSSSGSDSSSSSGGSSSGSGSDDDDDARSPANS